MREIEKRIDITLVASIINVKLCVFITTLYCMLLKLDEG
jgi:hypothetical protein